MTNRDIALEYLRCFCAGDIDGLEPLLAHDLIFNGIFHSYRSSAEYLAGLRSDPPEKSQCHILGITADSESVALFYEYRKPDRVMQIAQLFKISELKINEILLIFDGR